MKYLIYDLIFNNSKIMLSNTFIIVIINVLSNLLRGCNDSSATMFKKF